MRNNLPAVQFLAGSALSSPHLAGAKAYQLGQLAEKKFAVPPFFCIAAQCQQDYSALAVEEKKIYTQQMVNSANGRMYYQISNWYTVLKFLPFQQKIIPVWQRMMGVESKQYDRETHALRLPTRIRIHGRILRSAFDIPQKMDALEQDFSKAQDLFCKTFRPGLEPAKLIALFEDLARIVLQNWDITLLNDMYAFVFTGLLEWQFQKSGIADDKEQSNRLLAGNKNISQPAFEFSASAIGICRWRHGAAPLSRCTKARIHSFKSRLFSKQAHFLF